MFTPLSVTILEPLLLEEVVYIGCNKNSLTSDIANERNIAHCNPNCSTTGVHAKMV